MEPTLQLAVDPRRAAGGGPFDQRKRGTKRARLTAGRGRRSAGSRAGRAAGRRQSEIRTSGGSRGLVRWIPKQLNRRRGRDRSRVGMELPFGEQGQRALMSRLTGILMQPSMHLVVDRRPSDEQQQERGRPGQEPERSAAF